MAGGFLASGVPLYSELPTSGGRLFRTAYCRLCCKGCVLSTPNAHLQPCDHAGLVPMSPGPWGPLPPSRPASAFGHAMNIIHMRSASFTVVCAACAQ